MAREPRPTRSSLQSSATTSTSDLVSLVRIFFYVYSDLSFLFFPFPFIVQDLGLQKPQYLKTASYGHFGNSEYSWEKPKELKL